jgi:hypothetical protein
MRSFFMLLLLTGCCRALAQSCDAQPYPSALHEVAAGRELAPDLSTCASMPGDMNQGVAAFVFVGASSSDDIKTYDLELAVLDLKAARLTARLSRTAIWESDATKIDSLEISARRYAVRPGSQTFALIEWWSGSSRISFYNENKLSLFERQGTKLVPLISELVSRIYQGDGCDTETTRDLEVQRAAAKGYATIRVSEVVVLIARDDAAGCDETGGGKRTAWLRYRDGRYAVPEDLGPFRGPQ